MRASLEFLPHYARHNRGIWIIDGFEEFESHMAGGVPSLNADDTPRVPTGQYPAEYPNPLRAAMRADLMPPIPGLVVVKK